MTDGAPAGAVDEPTDPAAEVGISLADLREARDGQSEVVIAARLKFEKFETMLSSARIELTYAKGRLSAFDALIGPLEQALVDDAP